MFLLLPTLLHGLPLLGPHEDLAVRGSHSVHPTPDFCLCPECPVCLCISNSYPSWLTCSPPPRRHPQCFPQTLSWLEQALFSKLRS